MWSILSPPEYNIKSIKIIVLLEIYCFCHSFLLTTNCGHNEIGLSGNLAHGRVNEVMRFGKVFFSYSNAM